MSESTATDGREGKQLGDATVTFKPLPQGISVSSPVLDGESEVSINLRGHSRERFVGDIDAALEHIFAAPGFDGRIDADDVEAALGNTLIAVIETDERSIVATHNQYDASEAPSRENLPVRVGDVVPDNGSMIEYMDYPTDGPLFQTQDGHHAQLDDFGFLIVE